MAPAAMMTSRLAFAVYRRALALVEANSTPDAVSGLLPLFQLIVVTYNCQFSTQYDSLKTAQHT